MGIETKERFHTGGTLQVSFLLEDDDDDAEMVAWTTTPW